MNCLNSTELLGGTSWTASSGRLANQRATTGQPDAQPRHLSRPGQQGERHQRIEEQRRQQNPDRDT